MTQFEVQDPDFERRVQASFRRQKMMETIGASLTEVTPGKVEIELPFQDSLTQQNGFLHAGVITTIVDTACGYAAYTLMPSDASVLTVEFKVNLLAPAVGDHLVAQGQVIRSGRRLMVCRGDVYAVSELHEKLVATMLATMMTIQSGA